MIRNSLNLATGKVTRRKLRPAEIERAQSQLRADNQEYFKHLLKAHRYEREIAGIAVDGILFHTTRDGRQELREAARQAVEEPDRIFRWVSISGRVELTAAQIVAARDAVNSYVQRCMDAEGELEGRLHEFETAESLLAAFDSHMSN